MQAVADRGERVSEFVGQRRQELVLPAVALAQLADEPEPLVGGSDEAEFGRETLGLMDDAVVGWIVSIDRGLMIDADRDPEEVARAILEVAGAR